VSCLEKAMSYKKRVIRISTHVMSSQQVVNNLKNNENNYMTLLLLVIRVNIILSSKQDVLIIEGAKIKTTKI
jgi:hypothetical protein